MYAKIEPSGCCVSHGSVQIRLAFYLEPGDARYEEKQDNPFHNHFLKVGADITDDEIEALAAMHLVNFYEAWRLGKSIRSGWATEHRKRPTRHELHDAPEVFAARVVNAEKRVATIKKPDFAVGPSGVGRVFPSTDIDVGPGAIDRAPASAD